MAKRDKKKIIKVAVIGNGKMLRGLSFNMAAINLALYGSVDPDTKMLCEASKKMWECAYPKLRRGNNFGIPIIFGTAGDNLPSQEYYKKMMLGDFNFQDVFVPIKQLVIGKSMIEQINESIKKGEYLPQEEIVRKMSIREAPPIPLFEYLNEYPLTPKQCYNTINPIARESATMRMEDKVKTLGEKRCGVNDNGDVYSTQGIIRKNTASLIDLCETMRGDKNTNGGSPEKQRLISLAQTAYQEAKMWAIEASFTE